ncbi:DUF5750 family protein [Methanobrevibacter sp.]|uniref:DUF5750 family protein n=1 Tax=Methanobrevibacter sp. TaxID=66852 RepID=UPI0026DF51D6|nr:DUF5750 family protein [Methanobrevibacter sp.]MDO5860965.1 hypothetical protein [Methanobrevibacter sp.]
MIVKISEYDDEDMSVEYWVYGLSLNQMKFINDNLEEKTTVDDDILKIKMYFSDDLYPFQSEIAQLRLNDFIAREEIEMNVFLSSFLEDM